MKLSIYGNWKEVKMETIKAELKIIWCRLKGTHKLILKHYPEKEMSIKYCQTCEVVTRIGQYGTLVE